MNARVAHRGADGIAVYPPLEECVLQYQDRPRRARVVRRFAPTLLVIMLIAIASIESPARATGAQRDEVREAAIIDELRARAPEAVPDFEAATVALDESDYPSAAAGYRRVLEKAPDFDAALRRLGACLIEEGKTKEGIAFQERAVSIRRTPENLCSLAWGLTNRTNAPEPSPAVLHQALLLTNEAVRLAPADPDCIMLKAMIELQLKDETAFRKTSAELSLLAPDLMATHYYAAIAAAMEKKWTTAAREIRKAGRLGLPRDVVGSFLATGVGVRASALRWGTVVAEATGAWILGLVLMFIAGKALSIATLASIERDDPNKAVSKSAHPLRTAYRFIVTLAGVYWYASLPFVAIIVVAVTAAIIYGCMAAGQVPVKLVGMLAIGTMMSLYAIVRSLLIRVRDDEDLGRAIKEADAPGLWKTARAVAEVVGTRPIDEIWLTPGTGMAVLERGSMRQRMKDSARRALLLGAGVIEGFEQGAFRAILAHEYGHFAQRDTAGGEVALRVRGGMVTFAIALGEAGFAVWWNLAFQFLRLYDLLFRRISHGATRLQEVLADRVAIQLYGLDAFRSGLTHIIRRSILFNKLAGDEINRAVKQKRLLSNLYSLTAPSDPTTVAELEKQVTEELQAKTTEDNTHPSPKDRFRLGQRIISSIAYSAGGYVWQLFQDPVAITAEMTSVVAEKIATSNGTQVDES